MRVAFRADATPYMGSGHIMRCLALADALKTQDCDTVFVAAAIPRWLESRLAESGHAVRFIESAPAETHEPSSGWETHLLPQDQQRRDAERTLAAIGGLPDWMVTDHYLLDADWERVIRGTAARLLVLDDLANRAHSCDLLLDQTLGRSSDDYRPWARGEVRYLLGPQYALLRPEFARERPAALARHRVPTAPRNILISLGGTDVGGFTLPAVSAAVLAAPGSDIHVVIGADAPCMEALRDQAASNLHLHLHVDTNDMAFLMRDADIAIGGSGSTSWERCCLGLPTVMLVLAENQRFLAAQLAAADAAEVASVLQDLPSKLGGLVRDERRRVSMTAAAAALVDGQGVRRVIDAMEISSMAQPTGAVSIRPATLEDAEPLWLWRNEASARRISRHSDPICWSDHWAWLQRTLATPERHLLVAERGGEAVAVVRFDRIADPCPTYEVSINVRPDARGGGVGKEALTKSFQYFLGREGSAHLLATVHASNGASLRIFEGLGFSYAESLDSSGFKLYVRHQDAPKGKV